MQKFTDNVVTWGNLIQIYAWTLVSFYFQQQYTMHNFALILRCLRYLASNKMGFEVYHVIFWFVLLKGVTCKINEFWFQWIRLNIKSRFFCNSVRGWHIVNVIMIYCQRKNRNISIMLKTLFQVLQTEIVSIKTHACVL